MGHKLIDGFYWDEAAPASDVLPAEEKYKLITSWAGSARGRNPNAFDAITEWMHDDSEWTEEKLAENEQILMHGVLARFKEQNARLRASLKELEASGVVNAPVFKAIDRFDDELSGKTHFEHMRSAVSAIYADFSKMLDKNVRIAIAGNKTGPEGVNYVDVFGFINGLKDCDASVQWALFMPDVVKNQQKGFKIDSFECKSAPAMRFIGRETVNEEDMELRLEIMRTLDTMVDCKSGLDHDVLFMHHFGKTVDVGPWHGFWGRFMKAGAHVPEGFISFDFVPKNDGKAGAPFISQFAYATFSGNADAMHKREGYDSDAMYDVTRNIMLGQGINIPYPDKYWTAEVFLDGCDKPSTAYMFSAEF